MIFRTLFIGLILAFVADAAAENKLGNIRIVGRAESTVIGATVQLEDVADVSSPNLIDDEAVIALKRLSLGSSPKPGEKFMLSADQIIQTMRRAGVNLEVVGYSLPRSLAVTRAGRTVSSAEVQAAIEQALNSENRGATIRSINYRESILVAPGEATIEAKSFLSRAQGQRGFEITVKTAPQESTSFKVTAIVDEWREVPVATKSIGKGELIGPEDVAMARLNTNGLPQDTLDGLHSVVGLAAKVNLAYGEPISKKKLALPVLVAAGSKVTMTFKSRFLDATATGIAMENGGEGESIRIKNESSSKIIEAIVVEPGLVTVTQGE